MDLDSLQAELNALRKLYGLLHINGSSEQIDVSKTLDEESRALLRKLLDDASEKVFEAHIKIMADNWKSVLGTQCLGQLEEAKSTEISQTSIPSNAAKSPTLDQSIKENIQCQAVLQKDGQPSEIKKSNNAPSLTSRLRRSVTELQSRKKQCLSCEQGTKLDESTKTSDEKSATCSASSTAPGKEVVDKASHAEEFSKEVDDAIKRIESLIPSLHRLAKPIRAPTGKKMDNQDSLRKTNLFLDLDASGSLSGRMNKVDTITAQSQGRQSKQADQGSGYRYKPAPRLLLPPQTNDYESLKEDVFEDEVKLLKNNTAGQNRLIPKTPQLMRDTSCEQDDSRSRGHTFLEEKPIQRTSVPSVSKSEAILEKTETTYGNVSKKDNVAGQIPNHIQEMRISPSQFNEDNVNQYRIPQRDVRRKTPTSSSASFMKTRERVDKRKSVHRANQVQPGGSVSPENNLPSRRKTSFEESNDWPQQGNFLPAFDESEETPSGSPGSSSWTTVEARSSSSRSDTIQTTSSSSYTGDNEDSGLSGSSSLNDHDVESVSSGTRFVTSQTSSRYDASTNSAPDHGGDLSLSEYYQSSHHSVRHMRAGMFKRLKNKLGLIFHHHHHHHHHHHDNGGQALGSVWKPLGKMFRHNEKREAKNKKTGSHDKGKHLVKSGSRKQQVGHFHALVEGLMRHVKHSKKSKQGKGNVGKVGGRRLGGKKVGKKQSWWQNKAKVKLRGKDKKPQLIAPKSHLRHS